MSKRLSNFSNNALRRLKKVFTSDTKIKSVDTLKSDDTLLSDIADKVSIIRNNHVFNLIF